MPKIHINGLNLYYEQAGQGDPLVFISGLGADHSLWDVPSFSDRFSVLTFDNRACGQSETPAHPFTLETLADDVVALCRSLGIKKAHFVGHSMGGHIVQWIGAKYPKIVNRLVIACSEQKFSVISRLATDMQVDLRRYRVPFELLVKNYLPVLFSTPFLEDTRQVDAFVQSIVEDPYRQTDRGYELQVNALREHDTRHLLQNILSPTCIIGCRNDLLTPSENSYYLAKHISTSRLHIIEECGHLPFIEKPELFNQLIQDFLLSPLI